MDTIMANGLKDYHGKMGMDTIMANGYRDYYGKSQLRIGMAEMAKMWDVICASTAMFKLEKDLLHVIIVYDIL